MLGIPIQLGLAAVLIIALLLIVPSPFRQALRATVSIRSKRIKNQVTTPIERELELVAGPQRVIDESHVQVQDLRGTLLHEGNVLLERQDELAEAEAAYYKASDDPRDTGITELVQLVAEKEQEVSIQQGVVDGVKAAVEAACTGVDQARRELRHVQMTIKSDEAKAKATLALSAAATVMEAARSITTTGSALNQASDQVNHEFEQSRARLEDMKGTPAEREVKQMADRQQLAELRARLDAKRAAAAAGSKPSSAPAGTKS